MPSGIETGHESGAAETDGTEGCSRGAAARESGTRVFPDHDSAIEPGPRLPGQPHAQADAAAPPVRPPRPSGHGSLAGLLLALLTVLTWSTYSIASAAGAAQGPAPGT